MKFASNKIKKAYAINSQEVYLLKLENDYVGTGGIMENEINRLFILPEYQGKGYGLITSV